MKTSLHLRFFVLLMAMTSILQAQLLGSWNGIDFYEYGKDTIEYPYDGKNITGHIQVINNSGSNSPSMLEIQIKCSQASGGTLNSFPNGSKFVVLKPGDTTYINNWFLELIQKPLTAFTEGEYRTVEVEYALFNESTTYSVKRTYTLYYAGSNPQTVKQEETLAGKIVFSSVSDIKNATLTLSTANWKGITIPLTLSTADTGYVFSTAFPSSNTWYLHVGGAFTPKTYKIDRANAKNVRIVVENAIPSYAPSFEKIGSVTTSTGFWKGAASNEEQTICVFPGQENWKTGDQATLKAAAKIYKYKFDGTKVWEYAPGWEAWGGDMSKDGKYVAYSLYTGTGAEASNTKYKIELLDGLTGTPIWAKEDSSVFESYEVVFSSGADYLAVGNTGLGKLSLYDRVSGDLIWRIPDASAVEYQNGFGQVRKIIFDENDTYMYVGSGDNYLRKVRVSDGAVLWRSCVGGWPFVNGLHLSTDEQYLIVGMKSAMIAYVRASDGKIMWTHDTGNFDDAHLSPDGNYAATFSGMHFETKTGEFVGRSGSHSIGAFSHDSQYMIRASNSVEAYNIFGCSEALYKSESGGLSSTGGEQAQWMHLSENDSFAIIAARDMNNPPSVGLAFFKMKGSGSSSTLLTEITGGFTVYPNPSVEQAHVAFSLLDDAAVNVQIKDIHGAQVKEVLNTNLTAGNHLYDVDTQNFADGIYMVQLQMDDKVESQLLVVNK